MQSLWNKNAAEEWNVYPLHPHYKAYKNQTIRPSTIACRYRKPALLARVRIFFAENDGLLMISASAVISNSLPLKLVGLKLVIEISINKVEVITLLIYNIIFLDLRFYSQLSVTSKICHNRGVETSYHTLLWSSHVFQEENNSTENAGFMMFSWTPRSFSAAAPTLYN